MSSDPPTESKPETLPKFAKLFVVWLLTLPMAIIAFFIESLRNMGPILLWSLFIAVVWTGGGYCAKIIHQRKNFVDWLVGGIGYGLLLLCSYLGVFFGYCAMSEIRFH